MEVFQNNDIIEKLLLFLTEKQRDKTNVYYKVYEKYEETFSEIAFKNHPIFGSLLQNTPQEVVAQNSRLSKSLTKSPILILIGSHLFKIKCNMNILSIVDRERQVLLTLPLKK